MVQFYSIDVVDYETTCDHVNKLKVFLTISLFLFIYQEISNIIFGFIY